MNLYRVTTTGQIYGVNVFNTKAYTPFDAAEKAASIMSWRAKEDIIKQDVIILDGSLQNWTFKSERVK